jgi:hypothetical protein
MMGRSKMFRDDDPREAQGVSPRTTIVGGRPPEAAGELPPVPTGIQKLLRLAAIDEAFREELLRRRAGIADAAGVELTASERAILAAIPAAQLAQMVEFLPPPPASRRTFLRQTASTAVMLLGGAVLAECTTPRTAGSAPDRSPEPAADASTGTPAASDASAPSAPDVPPPPDAFEELAPLRPVEPPPVPAGVRPDWVGPTDEEPIPVRPTVDPTATEGGIAPHQPEPRDAGEPDIARSDVYHPTRGIRPDVPERPPRNINAPGGARPDLPDDTADPFRK